MYIPVVLFLLGIQKFRLYIKVFKNKIPSGLILYHMFSANNQLLACFYSRLKKESWYLLNNRGNMLNTLILFMFVDTYLLYYNQSWLNNTCFRPSVLHWECNHYLCLRVYSVPRLDGFLKHSQWELLLSELKLSHCIIIHCSLCAHSFGNKESLWGKEILPGPRIPVCSPCYPLKSQTMGPVWTKEKSQSFSFS